VSMSNSVPVCVLKEELKEKIVKFKKISTKSGEAIILKMNREQGEIVEDQHLHDCDLEEIRDSLPSHQPRYLIYTFSHKHKDGRLVYPLVFIFYSPIGCQTQLSVMYAASQTNLIRELYIGKSFEIRDLEELTEDWLLQQLKLA